MREGIVIVASLQLQIEIMKVLNRSPYLRASYEIGKIIEKLDEGLVPKEYCNISFAQYLSLILDGSPKYLESQILITYPEFSFPWADRNALLDNLSELRKKSETSIVVVTTKYFNDDFWSHVEKIEDTTLINSLNKLPGAVEKLLRETAAAPAPAPIVPSS